MTMVISQNGALYTDSMVGDTSTGQTVISYEDDAKVVRLDGFGYLGLTGCLPSQFGVGDFYKEAFYLWLGNDKPFVEMESTIPFHEIEQDPHGILVTKKQTYMAKLEKTKMAVRKGKKTHTVVVRFEPVPDKHIVYVGASCTLAELLHRKGKSALEIIQYAVATEWFTGGNIHVYNRRYLKALPKKSKVGGK